MINQLRVYAAMEGVGEFGLGRMRTFAKAGFQISQEIPHEVWEAYEELTRRGYTKYQPFSTATPMFK